jgi:hypothetical protein
MKKQSKILTGMVILLSISLVAVGISHINTSDRLEASQSNLLEVATQDYQRQLQVFELEEQLHGFWEEEFEAINLKDKQWIKDQIHSQELI